MIGQVINQWYITLTATHEERDFPIIHCDIKP